MAVHAAPALASTPIAALNGALLRLRVWLAQSPLDARLAAGADPATDAGLSLRAKQLSSQRSRECVARGLERVLATGVKREAVSSALPVHQEALDEARPALMQVVAALRVREPVGPRGVALARLLLTEAASPLYSPSRVESLRGAAREAQLALTAPTIGR